MEMTLQVAFFAPAYLVQIAVSTALMHKNAVFASFDVVDVELDQFKIDI